MQYIDELRYILFDSYSIWMVIENLLVAICVSTIYFLLSKNKNVSILLTPVLTFLIFVLRGHPFHVFFIVVPILLQFFVLRIIDKKK